MTLSFCVSFPRPSQEAEFPGKHLTRCLFTPGLGLARNVGVADNCQLQALIGPGSPPRNSPLRTVVGPRDYLRHARLPVLQFLQGRAVGPFQQGRDLVLLPALARRGAFPAFGRLLARPAALRRACGPLCASTGLRWANRRPSSGPGTSSPRVTPGRLFQTSTSRPTGRGSAKG